MRIRRTGYMRRLSYDERLIAFLTVHKVYDNKLSSNTIKTLIRDYPISEFVDIDEDTPSVVIMMSIKQRLPTKVYLVTFILPRIPLKTISGILILMIIVLTEIYMSNLDIKLLIYIVALIGILKLINVTKWMK